MKGFLIFMVLLVGGSIYFITHTKDIGADAIAAVEKEEGPLDQSFTDQVYKDPAAFAVKYQHLVERRAQVAKWLGILGEKDMMLDIAKKTADRYNDSSLNTDPAYGDLLYRRGEALEDGQNLGQAIEANDVFKRYVELFPNGPHTTESSAAVQRLAYKYNFR